MVQKVWGARISKPLGIFVVKLMSMISKYLSAIMIFVILIMTIVWLYPVYFNLTSADKIVEFRSGLTSLPTVIYVLLTLWIARKRPVKYIFQ